MGTERSVCAGWGALLLAAFMMLAGANARASDQAERPNILYIMSDDHAAHAISCYGSAINTTPHIDRLAAGGMRFTNCFVTNSLCCPSRAAILTGTFSHVNGVPNLSTPLPLDRETFAGLMQEAGYQTAIVGKWHLHRDPTGFDHWDILPGQGAYHNPEFIVNGRKTANTGYVTDLTTDKSLAWLKGRDAAKPFMLMCHFKAPHRSWEPDAKHAKMYEEADIPRPATLDDDWATRSAAAPRATMTVDKDLSRFDLKMDPPAGLEGAALKNWKYQRYIKDYLRCVASIDDNVGRIMAYLDEAGLAENTVVVYTSDQGFFLGDHGWYDKRFMYEESLRMPFIVRYPPVVKPGSVCEQLVMNVDFAPTFLEYGGVQVPAWMQGESLVPLLAEKSGAWRDAVYYHYYEDGPPHRVCPHYGVRTARYKLIRFYGPVDAWEMYDLQEDPAELRNIADEPAAAATRARLTAELTSLRTKYKDNTGPAMEAAK